ncbi:hypothetical protein [Haloplasma contractile]|nr:hypothetical protein [Haloplasma contractile]
MNENKVRQFLLKMKIATNEIDDLNHQLKRYLNLKDHAMSIESNKTNNELKQDTDIINTINIEDELDVFGQVHRIGQEFTDTFNTDAIDEMKDELNNYKSGIKFELEDKEYDTITSKKERFKSELDDHFPNLSLYYKYLINESFYMFHDEVDDLIFLLERYFKFRKKRSKKSIDADYLKLGNDIYIAYRQIDEIFSRISLINSHKIKRLSDQQKRQLDSIVNLIHSLN